MKENIRNIFIYIYEIKVLLNNKILSFRGSFKQIKTIFYIYELS
jgi:hypothetical protein